MTARSTTDHDAVGIAWYDASNEATGVTGTGATLTLVDLVGGVGNLTTDLANAPTTGDASKDVNGLNVLYCDGTRKMGRASTNLPDTFHLFYVCTIGAISTIGDAIFSFGDFGNAADKLHLQADTTGGTVFNGRLTCANVGATSATISGGPYTGLHLWEVEGDVAAGTLKIRCDGVEVLSRSGYTGFTMANPGFRLFADTGGSNEPEGKICEVAICNAVRTGADRTNMQTYLKAKWGTP